MTSTWNPHNVWCCSDQWEWSLDWYNWCNQILGGEEGEGGGYVTSHVGESKGRRRPFRSKKKKIEQLLVPCTAEGWIFQWIYKKCIYE